MLSSAPRPLRAISQPAAPSLRPAREELAEAPSVCPLHTPRCAFLPGTQAQPLSLQQGSHPDLCGAPRTAPHRRSPTARGRLCLSPPTPGPHPACPHVGPEYEHVHPLVLRATPSTAHAAASSQRGSLGTSLPTARASAAKTKICPKGPVGPLGRPIASCPSVHSTPVASRCTPTPLPGARL